jgi:hypothetical protein
VIFLNSTSRADVRVQYDLRDIDGSTDNSVQPVALQYRIGGSGNFTNISSGFVADASTGPSLATLVTHVDVTLPSDCNGQSQLQVRIITTNAVGNDEWIGIDNIAISSTADATAPIPTFDPANGATNVVILATPTITFNEPVRKTDHSALVDGDLASLLTFKKTNSSGDNVAYTATIDATKKVITVIPSASLANSQLYYLAIGAVEDINGNETTGSNITFTIIAAAAPTITLTWPAGGESMYSTDVKTIAWTSANITNVFIEVYAPDATTRVWSWMPFVSSTPAAPGTKDITVPANAPYGTQYKIRVSDLDNPTVNSTSGEFTVIANATSLTDLKNRCIVNDIVRLYSEVVITFKASSTNIYIQDFGAGILLYDSGSKITTAYDQYDGITGLTGTVASYSNILEIIPNADPGTATSKNNTITPVALTAVSLNANYDTYESMIIKITDVTFADAGSTFTSGKSYNITDASGTTVFYTKFSSADYIGTTIPSGNMNVTGICMQYNTTGEIASRNLLDIELATGIEKASFRDLIKMYPVPATSVLNVSNVPNLRSVEILDVTGKVIRTINTSSDEVIQIPVSSLRRGMYLIRFNTTDGKVVRRFVKS